MRFKLLVVYFSLLVMLSSSIVKMATIMVDKSVINVGSVQGRKTVTVARVKGTIYDRNLSPLVNGATELYATLLPKMDLVNQLQGYMSDDNFRELVEKSKSGMPLSVRLNKPLTNVQSILTFNVAKRYADHAYCSNLLGYIDADSMRGVSGLEKVFDQYLSAYEGSIEVTYATDGLGFPVDAEKPLVKDSTSNAVGGVVLTIDKEIQTIIDEAAKNYIPKGSIIVMDAHNGDILALGSYPSFHPNSVSDILNSPDDPLINRAISLYDCGSVFKIVTALSALDADVPSERCYECSGSYEVDEITFHCHNRSGHGLQNMETAFANSCNAYFIQLALEIGPEYILSTIKRLQFDQPAIIIDNLGSPAIVMPNAEDLTSNAALANLSFGQGRLMVSPLQTTLLTGVIASGGNLLKPNVISGFLDNERNYEASESRGGKTLFSAGTVRVLKRMMKKVVTDGTGMRAHSDLVSISGKTGTAETGQFNEQGYPIVQSWFTGYFPSDYPKYVVTIMAEDAQNTGADTLYALCEIANNLSNKERNGN